MTFKVVGVILCVAGFAGGIISGANSRSFRICLIIWFGTLLFAMICFGLAGTLKKLNKLSDDIDRIGNTEEKKAAGAQRFASAVNAAVKKKESESKTSAYEREKEEIVFCANCGKIKPSEERCWYCGEPASATGN